MTKISDFKFRATWLEMRKFRNNTRPIAVPKGIWAAGVSQPWARQRTSAWHLFLHTEQVQFGSGRRRALTPHHWDVFLSCWSTCQACLGYSLLSPPAMLGTIQLEVPFPAWPPWLTWLTCQLGNSSSVWTRRDLCVHFIFLMLTLHEKSNGYFILYTYTYESSLFCKVQHIS